MQKIIIISILMALVCCMKQPPVETNGDDSYKTVLIPTPTVGSSPIPLTSMLRPIRIKRRLSCKCGALTKNTTVSSWFCNILRKQWLLLKEYIPDKMEQNL